MSRSTGLITGWFSGPSVCLVMLTGLLGAMSMFFFADITTDDYFHQARIAGLLSTIDPSHWIYSLFTFFDGDSTKTQALVSQFALPWWTDPAVKISFFRPLSAITHWIDFQLWSDSYGLMHLHSVFWYAILLMSVFAFYRQIMPNQWLPLLALFLYGVDFSHLGPVHWVANRNALIGVSFCCWSLIFHHHWQQKGESKYACAAFLLYLLGLLAGEISVANLAFLGAYFLCLDSTPVLQRCVRYIPYIAITALWLMYYKMGDYGSANSGFYLDPLGRPLEFFARVGLHLPLMLFMQWFGYSTLVGPIGPNNISVDLLLPCLAGLALILWLVMPLLRTDKHARFFMLGSIVALLPVCAGLLSERQLIFSGIGSIALMSQILHAWSSKLAQQLPQGRFSALAMPLCALLWIIHGIVHPLGYAGTAYNLYTYRDYSITKEARFLDYGSGSSIDTAIIINAPNSIHYTQLYIERLRQNLAVPKHNLLLSATSTGLSARAVDDKSIRLSTKSGVIEGNLQGMTGFIYRDIEVNPFSEGGQYPSAAMTATIETLTSGGIPKSILFRFDQNLDADSIVFLEWRKGRFRAVPWEQLADTLNNPLPANQSRFDSKG